jgi:hypothetical protein
LAQEVSAHVIDEPKGCKVNPGPPVGRYGGVLKLHCKASGWPPPKYQWQRNGLNIINATSQSLEVTIASSKALQQKRFRCIHCKKINTELPLNIYRVICGNCKTPYDFPELEAAAARRRPLELQVEGITIAMKSLTDRENDIREDMKALENRARREKYANDRGETLEDVEEVVDKNADDSIFGATNGRRFGEKSEEDRHKKSVVEESASEAAKAPKTSKKDYKKMIAEFGDVEEGFDDDDDDDDDEDDGSFVDEFGNKMMTLENGDTVLAIENGSGDNSILTGGQIVTQGSVATLGDDSVTAPIEEGGSLTDVPLPIPEKEENNEEIFKSKMAAFELEIVEIHAELDVLEKKNWFLMRKRIEVGEHDPCKVKFEGEGIYVCVVSNIRGKSVLYIELNWIFV